MASLGSWMTCDACDGVGHHDHGDGWSGGARDICGLCDGVGRVELPLTRAKVRAALEAGCLTDGYLCVSDLTEGRCDHCTDLAAAEFAWMADAVRAHRAAGHHCNPYSAEGCHCEAAL